MSTTPQRSPIPEPRFPADPDALNLYHEYHTQFAAELRDEMCEAALRTHRPALSARPFIRAEYLPSAREKAYARRRNRFSLRELLLALGAALFGAGFENGGAQLWAADYGTSFAAWVLCTAFGAIVFMFALILL